MSEQEAIETTTEQAPTEATRDDLIAAVREAGGTASEDAVAAPQPAAEAPTAEEAPSEDAKLEAVLKAREERHRKRFEVEDYAKQVREQAEAEKQRIIEEARAEARRLAEQDLEEFRAQYRRNPTAALRALAQDPQEIVDAVLNEDTPQARALRKLEEEAKAAREEAKAGSKAAEELAKFKADLEREKQEARYTQVRDEFLTSFASPEKAPYMHARWDTDEVFQRCDALCREWQSDGLKLGVDFDRDTLVAYLEKQSRERYQKLPNASRQVSEAAPAKGLGNAPQVTANGTRTLSAAQGSERRTAPRPISEMTAEEARQALIEEVAAARRANPDATS